MYVQGMSSSLPAHIQLQFMQTIPGLEHCKMMRAGYAIDYDCLDPLQLRPSLEHKAISGLFSAGQAQRYQRLRGGCCPRSDGRYQRNDED